LGVIAALGDGLGAGLQPSLDLRDFGIGVLQRIDPVPFGGQPVAGEKLGTAAIIAGQFQGSGQYGGIHEPPPDRAAKLEDHGLRLLFDL